MMKYAQDKSDLESPMYSKLIMLLILTILCDYLLCRLFIPNSLVKIFSLKLISYEY